MAEQPHIIALLSQKGGPGKTTTSINLAAALAQAGHPSLVIDKDPQRAAGRCLGVSLASPAASIYKVLLGEKTLREIIVRTECTVHIRGVVGSSPIAPIRTTHSVYLEAHG